MNRNRSWRIAVLAGFVLFAVAALGAGASHSARAGANHAAAGGTLIDGTTDSVTNLDPSGEYDYGSFTATLPIFEGLLTAAPGPKIVPGLATHCAWKGGGLTTYSCSLRKGVKFHNGDRFTSADVKWSFDRSKKIQDPSGIYTLLDNLASVTTNGSYGVTFHLKTPQASWPLVLAGSSAGFIVDRKVYPADKLQPNTSQQVGTGPYQLVRYTPGQQAVFKAFKGYWGAKPKNSQLIIRYYSKSSTMKLALQRGEIDMAFRDFTPTELASLGGTSGIAVHKGPGVVIRYLVLNVTRPPTNNPAVRKAIAYLMPRKTIASSVYHGNVRPLYSMVPAGLLGHIDAFASAYGRSPSTAKARTVLQNAGVSTPVALDLWYTPSHYGDASADEYAEIKRALDASGLFNVTLKSAEWAQYSKTLGRVYNAFQLGWFPDYVDPEDYLTPFYRSDTFTEDGYQNGTMETLLRRQAAAKPKQRVAALHQAQTLAAKDVPIIPYWQGLMIAVSRKNVHGIDKTLDAEFWMRFWLISKS